MKENHIVPPGSKIGGKEMKMILDRKTLPKRRRLRFV
jgi:hypothetical protein